MERYVVQRWGVTAGVAEAYVLEANAVVGFWTTDLIAALLGHFVRKIFGKIRQIEIVFIHAVYRSETAGHRALAEPKLRDIHGHLPNSDDPCDRRKANPAVGEIERGASQYAQAIAPSAAPQHQAFVFVVNREKNIDIAL